MRMRLTESSIAALKPSAKPYEIHDAKQPGLVLRIQSTGVKAFKLRHGRCGVVTFKPRWPSLTLNAARERARSALVEVDQHGEPSARRPRGRPSTFGAFVDHEYASIISSNRAAKATLSNLRSKFRDLWSKSLRGISAWDIEKFKAARIKANIAPATLNRDLDRIRACLGAAVKLKLIDRNPVPDVKRMQVDNARTRYLSADEERALRAALAAREKERRKERKSANARLKLRKLALKPMWPNDAFTDHLAPLVVVALNTGLRRGELLGLTWENVSLERRQLTVTAATAKSQRTRYTPLNEEALDVLTRWKAQSSGVGHVFPGLDGERISRVDRSWHRLVEAAGLKDFRFHDLRHSFASKLVLNSVDLYSVQTLLGHSNSKLTQRYAHLSPGHLADAVATLGGKRR